jgi:vesicle transport protein SEC22
MSLDTFMSKTARLYQDTRNVAGGSNIDKLNDELQDVTKIMTKNMEELLWRGDSLDRKFTSNPSLSCVLSSDLFVAGMSHLSTSLRSESEKYRKAARNINFQAMIRQYAPVAAVLFVILVVIFWKLSG